MFKVFGIVIISLFLSQTIKHTKENYSIYISLAVSLLIMLMGITELSTSLEFLSDFGRISGYSDYIVIISKALGVSLITESASEMCIDFGEKQLSGKLEFLGKCEILALSLPIIKDITKILEDLLL